MNVYERTTCACTDCVNCCKTQPGSLHPGDFERIADHLGETREQAKLHFWKSPGALVARLDPTGKPLERVRIGTITPRMVNGRCVFLDEQDRCRIHPVAPVGCAYFDTHMGAREGQTRAAAHIRAIAGSLSYQRLRDELSDATSYRPTPHGPYVTDRC